MLFRYILISGFILFGLNSCVPAKKYNDLLAKEKKCSEELTKYKTSSLDFESQYLTYQSKANLLEKEGEKLKKDISDLTNKYEALNARYKKEKEVMADLESQIASIKDSDARHLAQMRKDLEAKILDAQEKEDALIELEKELNKKQEQLIQREERVKELEEIIEKQDKAVKALREKIAKALTGFEDKGLTVEERNNKIYVSLEAKLLFASGSTVVSEEGKNAVIKLAQAIESEEDLEIIVEGHTDTDVLKSSVHPKNNWELSVLRATAVIHIMTENSYINPNILTAAGQSEYHPVDVDDKAKNRRIEVIIAPRLDQLFELIRK